MPRQRIGNPRLVCERPRESWYSRGRVNDPPKGHESPIPSSFRLPAADWLEDSPGTTQKAHPVPRSEELLLPFDRRRTGSTFETQLPQDLVHHDGFIEEGDDGTSSATSRTLQNVLIEDPTHQVRPWDIGVAVGSFLGRTRGFRGLVSLPSGEAVVRAAFFGGKGNPLFLEPKRDA